MKISELNEGRGYLEEGPAWDAVKKAGSAVGKGLGAAGQIAGAVPGAVAGLGQAFKQGYRGAKATVAGGPTDTPAAAPAPQAAAAPAGTPAAGPAPTAVAPKAAPVPTAEPAATAPAAAPAPKQPGVLSKIGSAIKGALGSKPAAAPGAEPQAAPPALDAATQARIAAAPHGYNAQTGQPNPDPAAAPAADAAPTKNAAATDTYEKLKGDIRKIQATPGAKTLPAEMAAKLDADMAKLAKGDKDSGAFAAQKILGYANAGYDVSQLQPKWMASSKAGERFLTQSVYREITKMLKEHGLTWANLGLRVRLNESVKGHGVFLSTRIATPVMPSASKIEQTLKSKFKGM